MCIRDRDGVIEGLSDENLRSASSGSRWVEPRSRRLRSVIRKSYAESESQGASLFVAACIHLLGEEDSDDDNSDDENEAGGPSVLRRRRGGAAMSKGVQPDSTEPFIVPCPLC